MKLNVTYFFLLVALTGLVCAEWSGRVVNKCDFDIWAKTTRQKDAGGNGVLDSQMVKVSAKGGIYDAAFSPTFGNGEGAPDAPDHAHGITIKLQKEQDPGFTSGHVYQLEYTPYWYQDPSIQWLSADLSVVDGNPFTNVVRLAEVLVNGRLLNPSACHSVTDGASSALLCTPSMNPCSYEWQPGHALSANDPRAMDLPVNDTCPPMNTKPGCSHPIECRTGSTGVFQFTLCA
ncbi:hypothetical protein BFW01_g4277 [Lasiodiplodia theobromae]|uniref:Antigenic thaumatin-like protein n=1 Tax=Lasiodiplodia theobromae TaxID=45133 RepID=A0A5N5D841_9PEZI|nr:BYS1 domain protein [Lasiodiplodia theobromae]KAB2573986.1 hypothetical protein DBV05_g7390 [Lasiodiplodia theobromae]KAF4538299.1 BYS1 domain protein [Lasiodiplodia theobromae]KAF9633383.1 hypothetical protein BFW01_g4277 [Lasiodiplodia theobromae]